MDASFIRKSGDETFGLDKFWNGCAGKAEKGLEASIISLIDVTENASLCLSVDQTEPNLVNQVEGQAQKTRVDFYAEQLEKVAATILQYTRIGVFDGFYAKQKFVDKTVDLGFTMISRLRRECQFETSLPRRAKGARKTRKVCRKGFVS